MRLNRPDLYIPTGDRQGDRTERGLLLIWTFNEMRRLKKIAGKLVQLPKDEPPGRHSLGLPFELPYTLNLPEREAHRLAGAPRCLVRQDSGANLQKKIQRARILEART